MIFRCIDRLAAAIAALLTLAPAGALAATVSVSGGTGASGFSVGPNFTDRAIAVEFSLAQDITNYTIRANAFCFNCTAGLWLHKSIIGPSSLIADSVGVTGITGTVLPDTLPTFTGQLLSAGTYFLIFSVSAGTGGWQAAEPPTLTEVDGTVGFTYRSETLPALAYRSPFAIIASRQKMPEFSVTGATVGKDDIPPIPLPAAGWMLIGAVAALGGIAGLRRSGGA